MHSCVYKQKCKVVSLNLAHPVCDHNPPTLQTDRQTDGRTDRQATCDRNTALCTKVHRAGKITLGTPSSSAEGVTIEV